MGRPSPESVRALEERQERTEGWWSTAIKCRPNFSTDAIAAIKHTIEIRNAPPRELSSEYRQYLTGLSDAVREGPEALYLFRRTRPSGKRENQQNLFKCMKLYFPMTFREFKELAKRLDEDHPL